MGMLANYARSAARHLLRDKGYSLINLLGLALGMACCLATLLFLRDELSFDRFHEHSDRMYRVTEAVVVGEQPPRHGAVTPIPLAPALLEDLPEVVEAARLLPYFEGSLPGRAAVSWQGEKQFYERFFWADPSLPRIFTLPVVAGDPVAALTEPNEVVLSRSAAERYFGEGEGEAVGGVLRIDTGFSNEDYRVGAVVEDLPYDSHFHFDVLASFSSLDHLNDQRVMHDNWWLNDVYTYILLAEGAEPEAVAEALPAFVEERFTEVEGVAAELHLQPVTDIHLRSNLLLELEVNGDISYVYIFAAVALITLLIACVNFVNLATARYSRRALEVGVRKAVGARRTQLIGQFLTESVVLAAVGMALAVGLVAATLPAFNRLTGKEIALTFDPLTLLGIVALVLVVGIAAGAYPAFFLSSFEAQRVLKGGPVSGPGGARFRKLLIFLQFAVSVTLLIGTGVIDDQLDFMRSQDLGFDMERVVVLPVRDVELRDRFVEIKDRLEEVEGVSSTTFSSLVVGRTPPQIGTAIEGVEGGATLGTLIVDPGFLDVFKLELAAGRNLQVEEAGDQDSAFLLNETAVRAWGWEPEEAVGRKVAWGGWKRGTVVGVVKDFHHQPLRFPVDPLILHIRPIAMHYLYVRLAPDGPDSRVGSESWEETLAGMEAAWGEIRPGKPFEHFLLTDAYDEAYRAEDRLGRLVGIFGMTAVFVACLGLLGLAAFSVVRRSREISIRQAVGGSITDLVMLLSKELVGLVLLANLVAWPLAYLLMRDWLEGFAFRTDLGPGNFFLGAALAFAIAALVVGYHAFRAAFRDPAEALRAD